MSLPIPEGFRQNMLIVHGHEKATTWLDNLPTILARCAQRWHLTLLPPVAHLSFHYVAPAVHADGTPVIIKACSPTGKFAAEAEALRLLAGPGMARLLAVDEDRLKCYYWNA